MTQNLIVSLPGSEPVLYELNADRIGIGRSPDNQIHLDDTCVSYSHIELSKDEDGNFTLLDLKSKNGTRLNGFSIQRSKLEDGDRILLAETIPCYFIELDGIKEPPPAVSAAPAADQQAAATYVTLHDKLDEFERKLERVRSECESKQKEFDQLSESIGKLEHSIEKETASGAPKENIEKLQKDLATKTQRVSVLRDDLDDTREKIKTLEATQKVAAKVSPGSSAPPKRPGGSPGEKIGPVQKKVPYVPGNSAGTAQLPKRPPARKPG